LTNAFILLLVAGCGKGAEKEKTFTEVRAQDSVVAMYDGAPDTGRPAMTDTSRDDSTGRSADAPVSTGVPAGADSVRIVVIDSAPQWYRGDERPRAGSYFAVRKISETECSLDEIELYENEGTVSFMYDGEMPGYILHIDWKPDLLFLVNGIPGMKAGSLTTWYLNPVWGDEPSEGPGGNQLRLQLPEIGEFAMSGKPFPACASPRCYEEIHSFQWRVRFGNDTWLTLPMLSETFQGWGGVVVYRGAKGAILWIGDIDNDAKPDIMVKTAELYELFLSTRTLQDTLWNCSASFSYHDPGSE